MEEIWKDVDGYEGLYQVSNLGRVKSVERLSVQKHLIREKILKISHSQGGYCDVSLYKNGKRTHKKIHRLVAEAFLDNVNNYQEVDHIDTNKDNNCADNLRWCTHSENHKNPLTLKLKREVMLGRKMTEKTKEKLRKPIDIYKDGKYIQTFNSYKELQDNSKRVFGVKLYNIYVRQVINGEKEEYHGFTFKLKI